MFFFGGGAFLKRQGRFVQRFITEWILMEEYGVEKEEAER